MEKERRFIPNAEARVQLRQEEGGSFLEGLGIVFNSWSENVGGFIERILPEAVEGVIERSDIRSAFNHDANQILGRVPRTMSLQVVPGGVQYTVELPDTTVGRDVAVSVGRGDVDGSSFQFTVAEGGDEWEETAPGVLRLTPDGLAMRTIRKFESIYEIGPVTFPAYQGTVVSARCLKMVQETLNRPDIAAVHAARKRELELLEVQ